MASLIMNRDHPFGTTNLVLRHVVEHVGLLNRVSRALLCWPTSRHHTHTTHTPHTTLYAGAPPLETLREGLNVAHRRVLDWPTATHQVPSMAGPHDASCHRLHPGLYQLLAERDALIAQRVAFVD